MNPAIQLIIDRKPEHRDRVEEDIRAGFTVAEILADLTLLEAEVAVLNSRSALTKAKRLEEGMKLALEYSERALRTVDALRSDREGS